MESNMILECDSSDIEDDNSSFSSCGSFLPSWEFCRVGSKATKEGGNDVDEGSDPGEAHSIVVEGYQFEPSTDGDTESEDGDPTEDIRRLFSTDWCECDHCECMGTIKESRCCQEIDHPNFAELLLEGGDIKCITHHPGFTSVCLDPYVLRTCYTWHKQQHRQTVHERNNRHCYIAYRMLVRFIWGFLGKDIRVTLPACAVLRIRKEFPSADGKYTGYLEPEV